MYIRAEGQRRHHPWGSIDGQVWSIHLYIPEVLFMKQSLPPPGWGDEPQLADMVVYTKGTARCAASSVPVQAGSAAAQPCAGTRAWNTICCECLQDLGKSSTTMPATLDHLQLPSSSWTRVHEKYDPRNIFTEYMVKDSGPRQPVDRQRDYANPLRRGNWTWNAG